MASEIDRLLKKLQAALARTAKRVDKAMKKAMDMLLVASLELCPIDPDTPDGMHIYDSGHVKKRPDQGESAYGVSYGIIPGRSTPRSRHEADPSIVHENMNNRHGQIFNSFYQRDIAAGRKKERRPQEQANFLRQPEEQLRDEMREIVKEAKR